MPFTITASVNTSIPGAINLVVSGDASVQSEIHRIDPSIGAVGQPVRNYSNSGSGLETVTDCEAPLGRAVYYNLIDVWGGILAQSAPITAPALASGKGILRSVLRPQVVWMEVEPQDETAVSWDTSTQVYEVVGSDTPVVVGEVRRRHSGTMSFLCKSLAEADEMVKLLRDGTPVLLRHDPCAQPMTRDILFYALGVTEVRWQRGGWRLVVVDYQSTKFVPGETDEPPFIEGWDFAALADAAPDFATLTSLWPTFAAMATEPMPAWAGR